MLLALAAALLLQDPGPVYNGRARELQVSIPRRADVQVTVDGRLDEPVWNQAAVLTGFSQYRPVDGLPAEDSTRVLVWYSSDAIYFGIRAWEPHGATRATLADRDAIDTDDNIQILLDTYDDHRRAFEFAVNPLGIQEDGVRSEGQDAGAAGGGNANGRFDGVIDLNPDFVWQSHGHVTEWGYEVEVRIPFKSIRFQSVDPQTWGIQIVRQVMHSGYEDTWTPVVRANASFLIQAGQLVGLTDLHRGLVMDLNPEFTTKIEGAPTAGGGYDYDTTPEIGGNLHWGLTSNLSLSATAHPDFSQVEADVAQVTVNQRFALFFPEKRPFFLDGLEQYDTPNRLIYTRQIVQPVAGAKLIGKVGSTNVAYLGAVDQADAAGSHPVFNLLRVRHDLGASSTVGLVATDREQASTYNRLVGADTRFLWRKIWFSQFQFVRSWTDQGGGSRAGTLWDAVLGDRTGRNYGNHFEFQGVSRDFVAASGFVNRTDVVTARIFNRFTWYGRPGALVEQVSTFLMLTPIWRYDDFWHARGSSEGGYGNSWNATLRGGWSINAGVNLNHQRFDAEAYPGYYIARSSDTVAFNLPKPLYGLWNGSVGFSSPNRPFTFSANLAYGASAIFAEAAKGRELETRVSLTWRPTRALRATGSWTHDRLTRARDGSEFALANIPRLEVDYQLTRALFVRYIGQYVAQRQSALVDPRSGDPLVLFNADNGTYAPTEGFVSNAFRNDLLLSYKPSPGTVFFLGYGTSLTEPNAFSFSTRDLRRTSDGFFVKASYLWRL